MGLVLGLVLLYLLIIGCILKKEEEEKKEVKKKEVKKKEVKKKKEKREI